MNRPKKQKVAFSSTRLVVYMMEVTSTKKKEPKRTEPAPEAPAPKALLRARWVWPPVPPHPTSACKKWASPPPPSPLVPPPPQPPPSPPKVPHPARYNASERDLIGARLALDRLNCPPAPLFLATAVARRRPCLVLCWFAAASVARAASAV